MVEKKKINKGNDDDTCPPYSFREGCNVDFQERTVWIGEFLRKETNNQRENE